MISFDDWQKLEIKIGTVVTVAKVVGADKLLKLEVDLGEDKPRQILAGLAEFIDDFDSLVGKQLPFLVNLEPRIIRGLESQGMVLVADADAPVLLSPDDIVPPGTRLG